MAKRSKRKQANRNTNKHSVVTPVVKAGVYDIYHIGVLDGIRAVSILLVAWYHIWQQSWLVPVAGPLNLDWLVRHGAILVDMLILLSGFCLFLPYAREMVFGEKAQKCSEFYIKRVARIVPSYYFSLFVVLILFAIPFNEYQGNIGYMAKDIITHLTFTHNLFPDIIQPTKLNCVLWTVALEVQFYLIFPLLAKWFRKKPIVTYVVMTVVGLTCSFIIGANFENLSAGIWVNHPLTFISVYANGMLGAWLYMLYAKKRKERTTTEGLIGLVIAIASIVAYYFMCISRGMTQEQQRWQVENRYLLSLIFLAFVAGTIISCKWFQKIWDNKVMVFLATVSFNYYICHQYLAVKCKEFRFPDWVGLELPNMTGDVEWQWQYTIVCFGFSLLIAVAMTYLIERPAAKWILAQYKKRR